MYRSAQRSQSKGFSGLWSSLLDKIERPDVVQERPSIISSIKQQLFPQLSASTVNGSIEATLLEKGDYLPAESLEIQIEADPEITETVSKLAEETSMPVDQAESILNKAQEIFQTTQKSAEESIQSAIDQVMPESGMQSKTVLYGLYGLAGILFLNFVFNRPKKKRER